MQSLVYAILLVCVSTTLSYELVQDEDGQSYYLVPLHRQRRGTTKWDIQGPPGVRPTISHEGNIFNNENHDLSGSAYAHKDFAPNRPAVAGGNLKYSHEPSHTSLNFGAEHTQGQGTDLAAKARWDIINNKQGGLDLTGSYGRHYGGPGGTGRPEAGIFLNGHVNFP